MRNLTFCIHENKAAEQRAVSAQLISAFVFTTCIVQSLYIYSTIFLFLKSKTSSLLPTSVAVLPSLLDLVRNPIDRFSHKAAHLLESCLLILLSYMSLVMTKPLYCICENKDTDQLCGNRRADQRLCFCYTDSIIPLLSKSQISSL